MEARTSFSEATGKEDGVDSLIEGHDAPEDPGEALVSRALSLFRDDKVFQAHRLEQRVAKEFPEAHAAHARELGEVAEVAGEAERLAGHLDSEDGSWVCVKDAKKEGEVRVWYRAEEGAELHTLKVDYDMDARLEYVLVLLNEITLLHQWLPFIGGSELLSHRSRCERVAWVKVNSPAPIVLYHRDMCFYARALDGLDEDGCVQVVARSLGDGDFGVAHPQVKGRTTRMGLDYGCVKFIPLSRGRTRVRCVVKVDPKMEGLPAWLINWVATKVCWVGMRLWEWKAKSLERKEDAGKEHKQRMEEDHEFYAWMVGRITQSLGAAPEREGKGEAEEDPLIGVGGVAVAGC